MTVAELIAELSALDSTTLVCINTTAIGPGFYPADDGLEHFPICLAGHNYRTIVLRPTAWPVLR